MYVILVIAVLIAAMLGFWTYRVQRMVRRARDRRAGMAARLAVAVAAAEREHAARAAAAEASAALTTVLPAIQPEREPRHVA